MRNTKFVSDGTAALRVQARELVRKAEYQTQSRMLAYDQVGQIVGVHPDWLRIFIHGYRAVRLEYWQAMNIKTAYERLCERIEQRAALKEAVSAARERVNEITAGAMETSQSARARMAGTKRPE